jgi:hypothetical protein
VVDVREELRQLAGSRASGHDALLVVTELGPKQVQVALLLMLADFGEQLGLGTTRPRNGAVRYWNCRNGSLVGGPPVDAMLGSCGS